MNAIYSVIIVTVRNIIRPGSLAVRSKAIIIAGYLLISSLERNLSIVVLTSSNTSKNRKFGLKIILSSKRRKCI